MTGEGFFLILPYCNTECMNVFLEEMSKQYLEDDILMVCDGAAWHKSNAMKVPENITLLNIPPYTPDQKRKNIALPEKSGSAGFGLFSGACFRLFPGNCPAVMRRRMVVPRSFFVSVRSAGRANTLCFVLYRRTAIMAGLCVYIHDGVKKLR